MKKINERQETEIIDAEAVKRLSQDVTEETKAISVDPSANHKLRKETSRKHHIMIRSTEVLHR